MEEALLYILNTVLNKVLVRLFLVGKCTMVGFGQLLIILAIVFLLFGAGRFPQAMTDFGKGLRNFKKALKEDDGSKNAEEDKDD